MTFPGGHVVRIFAVAAVIALISCVAGGAGAKEDRLSASYDKAAASFLKSALSAGTKQLGKKGFDIDLHIRAEADLAYFGRDSKTYRTFAAKSVKSFSKGFKELTLSSSTWEIIKGAWTFGKGGVQVEESHGWATTTIVSKTPLDGVRAIEFRWIVDKLYRIPNTPSAPFLSFGLGIGESGGLRLLGFYFDKNDCRVNISEDIPGTKQRGQYADVSLGKVVGTGKWHTTHVIFTKSGFCHVYLDGEKVLESALFREISTGRPIAINGSAMNATIIAPKYVFASEKSGMGPYLKVIDKFAAKAGAMAAEAYAAGNTGLANTIVNDLVFLGAPDEHWKETAAGLDHEEGFDWRRFRLHPSVMDPVSGLWSYSREGVTVKKEEMYYYASLISNEDFETFAAYEVEWRIDKKYYSPEGGEHICFLFGDCEGERLALVADIADGTLAQSICGELMKQLNKFGLKALGGEGYKPRQWYKIRLLVGDDLSLKVYLDGKEMLVCDSYKKIKPSLDGKIGFFAEQWDATFRNFKVSPRAAGEPAD